MPQNEQPVLSQRRDLLEQQLDFYEPDVLPATQPIVSKHYRKTLAMQQNAAENAKSCQLTNHGS